MTIADYDRMLQRQHGVCAICERKPGRKRLCVDHCHVVNWARGLLCTTCNTGLGQFRDDPVLMRKGAAYLEAWRKAMGLDAAEDRAQLAFDFGPCDEPKRVPPKRIPPKRTAPAPVESGANSLPQCCPAVPSSRRVGHGVGWVERGHDIAAPAVSFVPRDTHHLDRGKLVDDGYRPNRSRENARSHSASKTRVNALMGSTHPTPWRDAGQQRSVDAPPKLGVGTRGEQRHRPGVGVMGRVGDELIVLDHLFLLMPTHDAGEVVEDVSRMFSKRDPLSRALRDPYRGLNAGDRALQDDRCAAAARPASDVST